MTTRTMTPSDQGDPMTIRAVRATMGRAVVPTLAVLVIGAGAAAASLSEEPPAGPPTTTPPTSPETPGTEPPTAPPVTEVPTTTQAPETAPPETVPPTSGADEPTPVACDQARTHGEYVSSIARTTPSGPGKGAIVSEAARSDCGKGESRKGSNDEAEAEDRSDDRDDEGQDEAGPRGRSGDAPAGKGKGKGPGKSRD